LVLNFVFTAFLPCRVWWLFVETRRRRQRHRVCGWRLGRNFQGRAATEPNM